MADMVVAPSDDRLFLDNVIELGITHGILTQERRRQLTRESVALSLPICRKFGLNTSDVQHALVATQIVYQLTSVGLERASQSGNILVAANLLTTVSINVLVGAVQTVLNESYQCLWAAVKHSCYTPDLSFYTYNRYGNLISTMFDMMILQRVPYFHDAKGYSFSRSQVNITSKADRTKAMQALCRTLRKEQCKIALSLRTSHDLDRWLAEVNTKVREIDSQSTQKRKRRQYGRHGYSRYKR